MAQFGDKLLEPTLKRMVLKAFRRTCCNLLPDFRKASPDAHLQQGKPKMQKVKKASLWAGNEKESPLNRELLVAILRLHEKTHVCVCGFYWRQSGPKTGSPHFSGMERSRPATNFCWAPTKRASHTIALARAVLAPGPSNASRSSRAVTWRLRTIGLCAQKPSFHLLLRPLEKIKNKNKTYAQ